MSIFSKEEIEKIRSVRKKVNSMSLEELYDKIPQLKKRNSDINKTINEYKNELDDNKFVLRSMMTREHYLNMQKEIDAVDIPKNIKNLRNKLINNREVLSNENITVKQQNEAKEKNLKLSKELKNLCAHQIVFYKEGEAPWDPEDSGSPERVVCTLCGKEMYNSSGILGSNGFIDEKSIIICTKYEQETIDEAYKKIKNIKNIKSLKSDLKKYRFIMFYDKKVDDVLDGAGRLALPPYF